MSLPAGKRPARFHSDDTDVFIDVDVLSSSLFYTFSLLDNLLSSILCCAVRPESVPREDGSVA